MKKIIIALAALLLSSVTLAHDYGYRQGPGYGNGGSDQYRHGDHPGKSIGRELIQVGVGGAIAIAAVQVGAAVGARVAQEISGTPVQTTTRVVYVPVATCDRTAFVRAGLIYANPCDGSGIGPVVIGSVDRR